jgi:hypothetical protein
MIGRATQVVLDWFRKQRAQRTKVRGPLATALRNLEIAAGKGYGSRAVAANQESGAPGRVSV